LHPEQPGHPDWHSDFQSFVLDLYDRLDKAVDRKGRAVILRRLKRALDPDDATVKEKETDNAFD
jgi:metallo-beta-lactamase family protein